ncbi:lipid-A-disaccharide synthase [Ottowia sp.]|jgi:lipid-A-disaccharide synthase|uniref:lipid-A-disaccharide synthase n=1 Tax=Ottowia sp. TaxID=1898956 RepID=UPI0025DA7189|nr:lipid-A-disaccharide synthase [Ottowia sp.]MBK6615946.1 lipid-A-disaccharide synthase [Ottowia sp.]MBK6747068.1 lipid-A-disaccharide synthase [Ottowia sp.]
MKAPRFGLVAGEASGDLLAGLLLDGLRARWPGLAAAGIGGAQMAARGFDAWWPVEKLSVRGYLEVLPRLPELLRIRRQVAERLLAERPELFIGVDAPDFNFGLEARLKDAGIKTLHFVSPSFWAWRPEKLLRLKAAADHVLCLFPFEPGLLAEHGIDATYVGHPLASVIPMRPDRAAARRLLGLPEDGTVIALLPGSRAAEVERLVSRFFSAAAHVASAQPATQFIVPAVPHLQSRIEAAARASGLGERLKVVAGQSHAALAACDATLIASGTATLEAALFKRPMVIAYAMPGLSYRLMRRRRQLPWIGLPNVLCAPRAWLHRPAGVTAHQHADAPDAPFVVPELVQDAATPEALARALLDWLDAPERIAAVQQRFTALHDELQRDTARLATDAIDTLLAR